MKKARRRQAKGLPFYKLQGAGNDAIVFFKKDLRRNGAKKTAFLRQMAHRQLGIGTDQFVEVLSLKPLSVQIWNGDGSTAEMCANGTRSFLYLAAEQGWVDPKKQKISIRVSGQNYTANRIKLGYELCLGTPQIGELETLALGKDKIPFHPVSTGNPHAVILCGEGSGYWSPPTDFSYTLHGPQIESAPRFPKKTNVEYVRSVSKMGRDSVVRVEAWERGAGATLSCGSGAVAVAALLRSQGQGNSFKIKMTDFELQVRFEGDQAFLSGPCALVAKGEYYF
ncbi:MAG: diaminopimelate epimerase [Bdellovibrionota bacterium]